MSERRVLITGVAGFIGSHLADAFSARGWRVAGFDNMLTGREGNVPAGVLFAHGSVEREFTADGCELVVHCAASYSDPVLWRRDVKTNVVGSINAAVAAKRAGARLLYFQTSLPPISSYAISKIAGQQYIEYSGVDHVVFRLANVYGPRNLSGPVPAFWKRISRGEKSTVSDTSRDMVFVDDLVDGVLRAVDRPVVRGVVDMCGGVDYRIQDVWHAVHLALGRPDAGYELVVKGADDVDKMQLSAAEAAFALGWRARTSLEDGVRAAVAWYEQHGVERTYTHLRVEDAA